MILDKTSLREANKEVKDEGRLDRETKKIDAIQTYEFGFVLFLATRHQNFDLFVRRSQHVDVLQAQFIVDDLNVADRIHFTLHVRDVFIVKSTWNQNESNEFQSKSKKMKSQLNVGIRKKNR